jgi:Tfp pilus assembly protein PilX
MPTLRVKRGFALPLALLVMVVLTAGIAAGYTATSAEVLTNAAHRGDTRAFNVAQAGLETFLARRQETGFCTSSISGITGVHCIADPTAATTDSEYATIALNGGTASIVSKLVRKFITDTLPAIYFIRSKGTDNSIGISGSTSSVKGTRTVGVYATWGTANVNVQGAWFALSGLNKNGNSGRIDGTDNCSAANGGGKTALAGAVIPSGGQFSGNTSPFTGSPPIDTTQTFAQLKANAKLDWAGIISGSIAADFEIPQVAFPNSTWFSSNPDAWPVIRIHTNNYSLPNAGRGMIIADSNFTISGSNMWDGIVLIGGKLTSNGNNTTSGATFAGLNYLLGGNPGASSDDSDANGQKTYVYNSCNVSKAAAGLRTYKQITNSWLDNLPNW